MKYLGPHLVSETEGEAPQEGGQGGGHADSCQVAAQAVARPLRKGEVALGPGGVPCTASCTLNAASRCTAAQLGQQHSRSSCLQSFPLMASQLSTPALSGLSSMLKPLYQDLLSLSSAGSAYSVPGSSQRSAQQQGDMQWMAGRARVQAVKPPDSCTPDHFMIAAAAISQGA